jgi:hypothetical protein
VARLCVHKGAQTSICPSQSPSRSFEMARPVGRASALGLRRFRDPNPISGPHGTARRADIDICLFWAGTGTLLLGWDTGDLPSQGKKLRASNPTRPLCSPRRDACGASPVPPHPLGVARSQSRGLTSSSSCRVVAPVAPQNPLIPSGGTLSEQRSGFDVAVPCRRVVASVWTLDWGNLVQSCTKLPQTRVHLCQPTMLTTM